MPVRKLHHINILGSKAAIFLVLLALTFIPIAITLPYYGVTFDEPIYMEAAWNVQKWLSVEPSSLFDRGVIDCYWKTDPLRNVHPSGLKWLYLGAQKSIFWENDPYIQNRVLNVFILTVSLLVFLLWWGEGSFWRGAVFILLLLTIPRFFAHTHFAATDIPMTSFLLLFIVCIEKTFSGKRFWLTGILLGILASIKITSLLFVLPVMPAFVVWYRHEWKTVLSRIILICLIGMLVFYALNPDWWFSPLSRCREFIAQTLTRRTWAPFTSYFGGHFYTFRGPFYYPFTMFLITTPLLHIFLIFSGLGFFLFKRPCRTNRKMILLIICLLTPFIILALPASPTNDGVRYLLPAFPFAACFMMLGLEKIWNFVRKKYPASPSRMAARLIITAGALVLFAGDIYNPARCPPFELSYYNKIVGNLSGAHRRGYETTYWFEILNDPVLVRLNEVCAGSLVYFPLSPTDLFFKHMLNKKKINFVQTHKPEKAEFMLIIGRPFVGFWEAKTWPIYRQMGKTPTAVWEISLDSVQLLRLYRIQRGKK
jgi:hypothetical protein